MNDAKLVLSEAQALGAIDISEATNPVISTNVINLGSGTEKTEGNPLMLEVYASVGLAGTGALLAFELQDCDTEGGTYALLQTSQPFTVAEVAAALLQRKPIYRTALPSGSVGTRQFVRLAYRGSGADATEGGTYSAVIKPWTR